MFDQDQPAEPDIARRIAYYRRQIVELVAYALAATQSDNPRPADIAAASPYAVALIGAGESLIHWQLAWQNAPIDSARPTFVVIVHAMLAAYRESMR